MDTFDMALQNINIVDETATKNSNYIDPHGVTIGHRHYSHRSPQLRAAVLGANDGLVSVSAILLGVSAATSNDKLLLLACLSAIVGGSLSMALGEYVSVSTQRDSERADIEKERKEHAKGPYHRERELQELADIYVNRGLSPALARTVAEELSKGDVIRVHMHDELGIDIDNLSSPSKASLWSGLSFLFGGSVPLISLLVNGNSKWLRVGVLVAIDMILFILFGLISSKVGGAPVLRPCLRIAIGGILALVVTFGVGMLLGTGGVGG
jgi:vacuolar iron transporter family protein